MRLPAPPCRADSKDKVIGGIPGQSSEESGFTLVELLVTILVAGIMAAAILSMFLSLLGVFSSRTIEP